MIDPALDQAFQIGMGEARVRFPTTLDRLIHLRTLPNLGSLASSGLTYIAAHANERHYEAGELVYRPEEPVTTVHLIVEGGIRVEQEGLHLFDAVPPFAMGFFPVIAKSPVGQKATALEPTVTLEISQTDLFEIFEDDFGFLENGLRQQSRQLAETQRELESRGLLKRSEPEERPYPEEPLDFIERLELTRRGPYNAVNLEPLVQLARLAEEVRYEPGDVLWEAGEPSTWGVRIIYGVVNCTAPERSFRMGPDSVLGMIESNGLMPRSYRAVAETRVVGLTERSDVLLDILEDHPMVAMGLLKFMAGALIDNSLRIAKARLTDPTE
ncbi:MAG: hypothetical protein JRH11_03815 [Deltaproteobacteria bacterium]|nr:hypothetical protein [Deltaproteobacteria bacterium]